MPTCLVFELPAALLLSRKDVAALQFWLIFVVRECNTALKNCGAFDFLIQSARAATGHPLSEAAVAEADEKRRVYAVCDHMAELASPVVLYLVGMVMGDRSFVKLPLIVLGRFLFAIGEIAIRGDLELESEVLVRFLNAPRGKLRCIAVVCVLQPVAVVLVVVAVAAVPTGR